MAFDYQGFATLGVNLNRQKYGPLDISNVFASEADLKYYLTKGTFTEGVSEYWYKNANEKVVPYPYEGQVLATIYDGVKVFVLKEKEDGTFETANVGDTSAAEAAIAELETALAALESKIGEIPTEEKDGEQVPVASTIIEYINKKTQGIATDAALGELQAAVGNNTTAIEAEKTRAEAAEQALDTKIGEKAAQSELTALANKVDAFLTGTGAEDALDSLQELIAYIDTHDDTDINGILASIQAIENKLVGVDTTVAAYVTAAIEALRIGDYAKASEVVSNADFTSYQTAVADTYATKADVYTTEEIDEMIAGINQGNQESASAVNTKLTNYITANDKEIAALKEKDTTLTTAVETAQAQADKGVADAKAVADNLAILDTKVTGEGGLTSRVAVLEQFDKDHTDNYNTLVELVNNKANSSNVYTKAETDGKISGAIDALNITQYAKSEDVYTKTVADTATSNAISSAITELDLANTYITKTDSSNNIAAAISTLSTNIADTYITSTQSSNDIAAAIDALSSEINIGAYITSSTANDTFAKIGDAYTKSEADAEFMTQDEVDARINALIAAADPENDGKIITDIQNLVEYVENNAGDIAELISTVSTNSSNISALQVVASSNSSYISDLIVTVSTNSSEINELQNIVSSNSSNIAVIQTAISSTIPDAIGAAKQEVLTEVSTKYVTADADNNLSLNGQTIVLNGGNAGISSTTEE